MSKAVAATLLGWVLGSSGCGERPSGPQSALEEPRQAEPERDPIRQGFTREPPPEVLGFEPPPPLLTQEEWEAARARSATREEREQAQQELEAGLREFGDTGEPGAIERIRDSATKHARAGRLIITSASDLYRDYAFPNDPAKADERYRNRVVVLAATVVPHNVSETTDIYKIFGREPYVQDPLLLQTPYDLTFVRCRLARPKLQKLADWQPIQIAGIVEGKSGTDVVLTQCVVLH